MLNMFSKFITTLKSGFTKIWFFLKGLGTKRPIVAVIAAVMIIGGVGYAFFGPKSTDNKTPIENSLPVVTLLPVSTYAEGADGYTPSSGKETVVRAETSGKIVQVLPVGTRVSQGTTIASFENATQRATLLQAEGALEAAKAGLDKTEGGLRSEKIAILKSAYESAQGGSVTTLLSSYAAVDSAVRATADQMFTNPESPTPRLVFTTSNSQRITLVENLRVGIGPVLVRESSVSAKLSSSSDLETELNTTENELRQTRTFIDELIAAINEAIPSSGVTASDIAAYKASATAARTSLTTSLSTITSARGALETAKQNLDEGLSGAENTDLAAAAASVKQAQGAYDAALATYQKTIVKAPTSGTVFSCNAAPGDVLSVGSDVCRIQSIGAVTADAFILPLSSVKYTPQGAFVFVVSEESTLSAISVETGLVAADGITVHGLLGDEYIVKDVRGLKDGEKVTIE